MAYTKLDLMKDLEKLQIDKKGTLLVHSSLKAIGEVEGGANTVLDALCEYMKDGLLVFPTHTWSYVKADNPKYYVETSPSCVGILPDLFRKRDGVIRCLHPTHSLAALGKDAEEFLRGNEKFDTPTNRESSYGKLLDRQGEIMLLGVNLTKNTFMHGVEEWVDIPGRFSEHQESLITVLHDGTEISVPSRRHIPPMPHHNFWKVEEVLLENGAMRIGSFGAAEVRICKTEPLTRILFGMLSIDRELFSNPEPLDREKFKTLLP